MNTSSIEVTQRQIDAEYNRLKGLMYSRHWAETKLRSRAKEIAQNKIVRVIAPDFIDISSLFKDKAETKDAKKLLEKYLQDFVPSTVSDKNNLKSLIYLEILQVRLQDKMNQHADRDAAIPLQMMTAIHSNLNEINIVKGKLGLIGKEKEVAKTDAYKSLELKIQRHRQWMDENQASRTFTCAHCGKMALLKIRVDIWETQKHPFFRDKILFNRHLIKLFLTGTLSKQDVASVLEVSADYIEWLVEKFKSNPEFRAIQQEIQAEKQIQNEDSKT